MAEVTKPIALDESFNTTESTSRNLADVLAEGLDNIAESVVPRAATEIPIENGSSTNTKDYIDTEKLPNTASYLYTPTVTEPTLTNGSNYNHRTFYYKHGTRVWVYIGVSGLQISSSAQVLFSLPTGYKPRVDVVVKMSGYSFANTSTVRIMTTGEVRAENTQDEGAFGYIEYDAYS